MSVAPALAATALGPVLCGHEETSQRVTFLSGPNTGQRWCGSCVGTMRRLVSDYDAGRIDITGVRNGLAELGIADEAAIGEFCRALEEE